MTSLPAARAVVGLGNPGAEYGGTRHNIGWLALDRLRARWDAPAFAAAAGCAARCAGGRDGACGPCAAESRVFFPAGDAGGAAGSAVWLVKPLRYMNRSGQALAEWLEGRPELALGAACRAAWSRPPIADELAALPDDGAPPAEDEDPFAALADDGPEAAAARERATALARAQCARLLVVVDDFRLPLGRVRFRPGGSDGGHNGLADLAAALGTEEYPRLRVGVGAPPPGRSHIDWVLGPFADGDARAVDAALAFAADAVEAWRRDGFDRARDRFNGRSATNADGGAA